MIINNKPLYRMIYLSIIIVMFIGFGTKIILLTYLNMEHENTWIVKLILVVGLFTDVLYCYVVIMLPKVELEENNNNAEDI